MTGCPRPLAEPRDAPLQVHDSMLLAVLKRDSSPLEDDHASALDVERGGVDDVALDELLALRKL